MDRQSDTILMFLNGTAMSGLADHVHVRDARFLGARRTAARYRFYAVRDEFPGLVPVDDGGASITGELYEMDIATWRDSLLPNEPAELEPGEVELDDGSTANVMILDLERVKDGDKLVDIAGVGGWRDYCARLANGPRAK